MAAILVLYHSQTGNTERLARAVAQGVTETEDSSVVLRKASMTTAQDMRECNAIVICSPEYFGYMAGAVKDLYPLILEDDVVLGHRVVVHGCRVGRGSLIGIGAIVLDGAEIGEESIIGAGSVVSPKSIIPPRTLAMGTPARVVRPLEDGDILKIRGIAEEYFELMEIYRNAVLSS